MKQETMPKPVVSMLTWSWERGIYVLYEQGNLDVPLLQGDDESWFAWLTSHTSFSFQGKYGRLNLQKERRPRGGKATGMPTDGRESVRSRSTLGALQISPSPA